MEIVGAEAVGVVLDVVGARQVGFELGYLPGQQLPPQLEGVGEGELGALHNVADCPVGEEYALHLQVNCPVEVDVQDENGCKEQQHSNEDYLVDQHPPVFELGGPEEEVEAFFSHFGQGVVFVLRGAGHAAHGYPLESALLLLRI